MVSFGRWPVHRRFDSLTDRQGCNGYWRLVAVLDRSAAKHLPGRPGYVGTWRRVGVARLEVGRVGILHPPTKYV